MTSFHKNLEKKILRMSSQFKNQNTYLFRWPCFFPISHNLSPESPTDTIPTLGDMRLARLQRGGTWINHWEKLLKIPMNQEKLKKKNRICIKTITFLKELDFLPKHWDFWWRNLQILFISPKKPPPPPTMPAMLCRPIPPSEDGPPWNLTICRLTKQNATDDKAHGWPHAPNEKTICWSISIHLSIFLHLSLTIQLRRYSMVLKFSTTD